MKKLALFLCCLFLSAPAVRASSAAKGTTSGEFLKIGQGARPLALGEAYTALADDALALQWNPGGLGRVKHISFALAHTAYLESVNYEYAAAAIKLPVLGTFAGSIQYQSVGDITQRDATGTDTGSFSPKDAAYTLGYGLNLGIVCLGLAGKYVQTTLADSDSTVALDAGVVTGPLMGDRLRLGAVASNVGGKLNYAETANDLPITYKGGASFALTKDWVVSGDVIFPKDNDVLFAVGTEVGVPLSGDWRMTPRVGYNSRSTGEVQGFTGFSFGIGFGVKSMSIDYALVPLGELGLTHRFSLGFNF